MPTFSQLSSKSSNERNALLKQAIQGPAEFSTLYDSCKSNSDRKTLVDWLVEYFAEDKKSEALGFLAQVAFPKGGIIDSNRRFTLLRLLEKHAQLRRWVKEIWDVSAVEDYIDDSLRMVMNLQSLFSLEVVSLAEKKFPQVCEQFMLHIFGSQTFTPEDIELLQSVPPRLDRVDSTLPKVQAQRYLEVRAAFTILFESAGRVEVLMASGLLSRVAHRSVSGVSPVLLATPEVIVANLHQAFFCNQRNDFLIGLLEQYPNVCQELLTMPNHLKLNNSNVEAVDYSANFTKLLKLTNKPLEFLDGYGKYASDSAICEAAIHVANTYSTDILVKFWMASVTLFRGTVGTIVKKYIQEKIAELFPEIKQVADVEPVTSFKNLSKRDRMLMRGVFTTPFLRNHCDITVKQLMDLLLLQDMHDDIVNGIACDPDLRDMAIAEANTPDYDDNFLPSLVFRRPLWLLAILSSRLTLDKTLAVIVQDPSVKDSDDSDSDSEALDLIDQIIELFDPNTSIPKLSRNLLQIALAKIAAHDDLREAILARFGNAHVDVFLAMARANDVWFKQAAFYSPHTSQVLMDAIADDDELYEKVFQMVASSNRSPSYLNYSMLANRSPRFLEKLILDRKRHEYFMLYFPVTDSEFAEKVVSQYRDEFEILLDLQGQKWTEAMVFNPGIDLAILNALADRRDSRDDVVQICKAAASAVARAVGAEKQRRDAVDALNAARATARKFPEKFHNNDDVADQNSMLVVSEAIDIAEQKVEAATAVAESTAVSADAEIKPIKSLLLRSDTWLKAVVNADGLNEDFWQVMIEDVAVTDKIIGVCKDDLTCLVALSAKNVEWLRFIIDIAVKEYPEGEQPIFSRGVCNYILDKIFQDERLYMWVVDNRNRQAFLPLMKGLAINSVQWLMRITQAVPEMIYNEAFCEPVLKFYFRQSKEILVGFHWLCVVNEVHPLSILTNDQQKLAGPFLQQDVLAEAKAFFIGILKETWFQQELFKPIADDQQFVRLLHKIGNDEKLRGQILDAYLASGNKDALVALGAEACVVFDALQPRNSKFFAWLMDTLLSKVAKDSEEYRSIQVNVSYIKSGNRPLLPSNGIPSSPVFTSVLANSSSSSSAEAQGVPANTFKNKK